MTFSIIALCFSQYYFIGVDRFYETRYSTHELYHRYALFSRSRRKPTWQRRRQNKSGMRSSRAIALADSLPRIKYKINCDDISLRPFCDTYRPPFRALFIVYASWRRYVATGGRVTARCLGPVPLVAVSTTIRHEDLRLWCPLPSFVHLPCSSLFSDISDDRCRRTGDR